MKNQYTFPILASAALLVVLILWMFQHFHPSGIGVSKGPAIVGSLAKGKSPGESGVPRSAVGSYNVTPVTSDGLDMVKPADVPQDRWDIGVSFFNFQKRSNGPIEFYGRIVDQYSQPIQNAKIRARVDVYPESFRVQLAKGGDFIEYRDIEMDSDADGLFSLVGGKARGLDLKAIEKDGYLISGRQLRNYTFGLDYRNRHHADRNRPEIFKMWKKGIPEPLIKKKIRVDIKTDGRLYSIDLIKGIGCEGRTDVSDFTISMSSDEKGGRNNWSVQFESKLNAFSVVDDAYLYCAPESGYTNSLYWSFDGSDPRRWTSDLEKKLYVVSREGNVYAGINLEVYEYGHGKGRVILDSLINPNSSRNLEYDKNMEIKGEALQNLIQGFSSNRRKSLSEDSRNE